MCPLKTQRDYALLSRIHLCCDNALFGGHFWPKFVGKGHKNIFKDWGVIFQNCQFEVRKGFEVKGSGDALKTSRLCHIEIFTFVIQSTIHVNCTLWSTCVPAWGFNRTNTRFCRESDDVATRCFFGLVWTQTLLRQARFDSDFTQISEQKNWPLKPLLMMW